MVAPLLHGCIVSSLGLVVRRARVPSFRPDITWGHDWDWEIRLSEANAAHFDAESFACYRVHEASETAEMLRTAQNGGQERAILEEALGRLPPAQARGLRHSTLKALALRQLYFAERAVLAQGRTVARDNLRHALRADPSILLKPTTHALFVASVAGPIWYRTFRAVRDRLRR